MIASLREDFKLNKNGNSLFFYQRGGGVPGSEGCILLTALNHVVCRKDVEKLHFKVRDVFFLILFNYQQEKPMVPTEKLIELRKIFMKVTFKCFPWFNSKETSCAYLIEKFIVKKIKFFQQLILLNLKCFSQTRMI